MTDKAKQGGEVKAMSERELWVVEYKPRGFGNVWVPHSDGAFLDKGAAIRFSAKMAGRYLDSEWKVTRYIAGRKP